MENPIINRYFTKPKQNPCGILRKLWANPELSFAYNLVVRNARMHKHLTMQEIYYITKGEGKIAIGDKEHLIKKGERK